MAFETPTPAYRSEALDELRQGVEAQEINEIDKQQEFSEAAVATLNYLEDTFESGPQNLEPTKYHTDESGTSLNISVEANRDGDTVIIKGEFEGDNGKSKRFGIYAISRDGTLHRANYDKPQGNGQPAWEKVSVAAKKDAGRVAEATAMLRAVVYNTTDVVGTESYTVKQEIAQLNGRKAVFERDEMAGDPEGFTALSTALKNAVAVHEAVPSSPQEALRLRSGREAATSELLQYGIDFSDKEAVIGLKNAVKGTLKEYRDFDTKIGWQSQEQRNIEERTNELRRLRQAPLLARQ